jgi:predicted nucleic acid-binding Zn ribbon protein
VRRRGPRPVALALESVTARMAPPTLLGELQRVWPQALGPALARAGRPVAEREGVVTIACTEAVWAQELDLMSERLVATLNDALGRPAVRRLRVQARPPRT